MRLILYCLLLLSLSARADILDPNTLVDWGRWAGVKGGIPDRQTIYTNLSPGVTLAAINAAIDNCPSNQVVKLAAGVYNLGGTLSIDKDGVTVRGAGTNTIFTNALVDIGIQSYPHYDGFAFEHSWTAHYNRGDSTITVDSTSGLNIGQAITLDQDNAGFVMAGHEGCATCSRGDVATDGAAGHPSLGLRWLQQTVRITGLANNDVTFEPPLYSTNWNSANSTKIWGGWSFANQLDMAGLEDCSVYTGNQSRHNTIGIGCGQDCWMRNVASFNADSQHVVIWGGRGYTIQHCYFRHNNQISSGSYGIEVRWVSDLLVQDCIFEDLPNSFKPEAVCGSVFAYNYCTNMTYNPNSHLGQQWFMHGGFDNYNLCEGNYWPNAQMDSSHTSNEKATALRNRLTGWEFGKTGGTQPIRIMTNNHYFNIIGNILGSDNYHSGMTTYVDDSSDNGGYIYELGNNYINGQEDKWTNTFVRHGNYDTFTDSIIWASADHDITNSLYLTSKPSWFGCLDWPPYDPTDGGNNAFMDRTNIPAGYRYLYGVDPTNGCSSGGGGGQTSTTSRRLHPKVKIKRP